MLKSKFKILLLILLVLLLITPYCLATGTSNEGGLQLTTSTVQTTEQTPTTYNQQTKNNGNWIYNDLFKIEDTINIPETDIIDGNAFIIGKNVTISGEIGGDLFVIADKLNIDGGYVYTSIFALANEITINGKVYDLYATCDTFNLGAEGSIFRDAKLTASNVNISGNIIRNAYISAKNLNFAENAGELISGNLNYSSSKAATIPDGVVKGEVNFTEAKPTENTGNSVSSYIIGLVEAVLFTFIVALLLIWLAPKFVEKLTSTSGSKLLATFGIGLIAPICALIACLILFISIIGAPISVCVALVFFVLLFVGKSITSIYFGKLISNKIKAEGNIKFILYSLLATVILWLVSQVPVIGGLVGVIATIFGIGLVFINIFRKKEVSE